MGETKDKKENVRSTRGSR